MTSTVNPLNNSSSSLTNASMATGTAAIANSSNVANMEDINSNGNNNSGSSSSSGNNISNVEAEYNRIPDRHGWQLLYHEIKENSDREANEKHYLTSESDKQQNRHLNRYRDVSPFDHSRVILHRGDVDYINANLVKMDRADRKYILTQGPLKDTVGHFWLMIWEQNSKAILMLNKLWEKKQAKCYPYWPTKAGAEHAMKFDDIKLIVEFLHCEEYKNFSRRWFRLTDLVSNQSREIMQFHYTTWPDFGIPSSPVAFLQFLKQVRDSGALDPDVGPAVVHCSAGIGRSGTFCLVDSCLVLIDKEGEQNVSALDVLYELRRCRMGLIQTADQLYFSYQAIIEGMKLLRDETFLQYKEEPIIIQEEHQPERDGVVDETPPPLPPRTHSLLLPLAGTGADGALMLNLPGVCNDIALNQNLNENLCTNGDGQLDKDALNNFINKEKMGDNISDRPLPPLPTQQHARSSLDRVHESDSDDNISCADEDGTTSNDEDSDDNSSQKENVKVSEENAKNKAMRDSLHISELNKPLNGKEANTAEGNNPAAPAGSSSVKANDSEIKMRKRAERQAHLEERVNEIKRKKRDLDEKRRKAAKKHRTILTYVAAGVVIGAICIYAYSKMQAS